MMMDKVDPFVSDEGRLIFQYVCYSGISQGIVVFGILANIINIIYFIQQVFREPVNVSLFGLAIADLGCLVSLLWLNICVTPAFQQADFSFDQIDIQYLTAAYPHIVFTRVTGWISAFITLERCLCIALPLQIKRIVTSRRVSIIISSTFVVLILSATPFYAVNVFSMKFHAQRNRTVLGLIRTVDRTSVETVLYVINNVISPFVAFTTVIICTATLVVKLGRKSKWRQSAVSSKSDALLNRDQKVAKMVLIISAVFIISFIPNCVVFIGMAAEPELAIDGMYRNTFIILFGIGFVLESINSAVNIFIYYRMSSKYRDVFQQIFRMLRIHGYISP